MNDSGTLFLYILFMATLICFAAGIIQAVISWIMNARRDREWARQTQEWELRRLAREEERIALEQQHKERMISLYKEAYQYAPWSLVKRYLDL